MFRKIFHFLLGLLIATGLTLGGAEVAAQTGFGVGASNLWRLISGNVIVPIQNTFTLGNSGNRIAGVYTNTLDALSLSLGGTVTGDQTISGNQTVYGSNGVTAVKFTATSTALGLQVDGLSLLTGKATTTAGIVPATAGGADIGSAAYPYNGIYATGTVQLGGALTVSNVNGGDSVQIGWEQSPAKAASASNQSFAPLNIYASSTGYQDAVTLTSAANGVDSACVVWKNLGASLMRLCQTSSVVFPAWVMSLHGLAFQSGNTTPFAVANVDLMVRNNNVGIGLGQTATPAEKLEVNGNVSTTKVIAGAGSSSDASLQFSGDPNTGLYASAADVLGITAAGNSLLYNGTSFYPATNNARDLGTLTLGWRNGYFTNVVSSTSLVVSGTGLARSLGVGSLAAGGGSGISVYHDPSQSEALQPFLELRNASSTLRTQIQFTNAAGDGAIGTITAFGENSPVGDFGFSAANMIFLESTSGTVITAGDGVTIFSSSGALRPITGLGFGNNSVIDPYLGTASTTITDGNMQTVALDFPNSAAAGTQDLTVTVAGAVAGAECQLAGSAFAASLFSRANETYTCVGTAANTMTVRRTCVAAVGCGDPASVNTNVGFFARQ